MPYYEDNARCAFFFDILAALSQKYGDLYRPTKANRPTCREYKQFGKKWGWQKTIYELANEDILNVEKVEKMNCEDVLTYLVYLKHKSEAEFAQDQFEETMRKNKR